MTHRSTFALNEPTALRLKRLALRWNVSQAEVVRRSVEKAEEAETDPAAIEKKIEAARQLRESLKGRINPEERIAMIKEARDKGWTASISTPTVSSIMRMEMTGS